MRYSGSVGGLGSTYVLIGIGKISVVSGGESVCVSVECGFGDVVCGLGVGLCSSRAILSCVSVSDICCVTDEVVVVAGSDRWACARNGDMISVEWVCTCCGEREVSAIIFELSVSSSSYVDGYE